MILFPRRAELRGKWKTILAILVAVSSSFSVGAFANQVIVQQVQSLAGNHVIVPAPELRIISSTWNINGTASLVTGVTLNVTTIGGANVTKLYQIFIQVSCFNNATQTEFTCATGSNTIILHANGGAGTLVVPITPAIDPETIEVHDLSFIVTGTPVRACLSQTTTFTSPNAEPAGGFGGSVAASGNIMVAGAPAETVNGQGNAGRAYTFDATTGALISTLTSPNVQPNGFFGSVAVSGNIVVVGAPRETANGQANAGHAYTFNAGTGALTRTLTNPNAQSSGEFGFSVAASGNIMVVGAPDDTVNGQSLAGHTYTFDATTGALISTLTSPNVQPNGFFGSSVAASGNIVVVGARGETVNGQVRAGRAYTFDATTGALVSTLTSPNAQSGGEVGGFGLSVAASGNIVVVGAPAETANGQSFAGHAYTFNATTGALVSTLTSPNAQYIGHFGFSVAVGCNIVVVGAHETANGQNMAGRAYAFDAATGALISTFTSPNAQSRGFFGFSVAVSGSIVVVGAPFETANGLGAAGHVYIV